MSTPTKKAEQRKFAQGMEAVKRQAKREAYQNAAQMAEALATVARVQGASGPDALKMLAESLNQLAALGGEPPKG